MAAGQQPPAGRALVVYTAARFGLFLVCAVVFYACGMGLLWALALGALLSGIAGYFLLARQRGTLSAALEDRVELARTRAAERTAREDEIADQLIAEQQSAERRTDV